LKESTFFEIGVVMAAGALGVGARMWVSGAIAGALGESFPLGTLVANLTGCFAIGIFWGLCGPDGQFLVPGLTRQAVMVGFLGGYTTFSSFSLQTLALLNGGQAALAALNAVASLLGCLLACWLGLSAAAFLNSRL